MYNFYLKVNSVASTSSKVCAPGPKYAHWIGLYLSFHLSWFFRPYIRAMLQDHFRASKHDITHDHVFTGSHSRDITHSHAFTGSYSRDITHGHASQGHTAMTSHMVMPIQGHTVMPSQGHIAVTSHMVMPHRVTQP